MRMKYDKNTNSANLSKYSLQKQPLFSENRVSSLLMVTLKKSLLVHGTEKLCSKFVKIGPEINRNLVPRHWTSDTLSDFIFCPMQCIGQMKMSNIYHLRQLLIYSTFSTIVLVWYYGSSGIGRAVLGLALPQGMAVSVSSMVAGCRHLGFCESQIWQHISFRVLKQIKHPSQWPELLCRNSITAYGARV